MHAWIQPFEKYKMSLLLGTFINFENGLLPNKINVIMNNGEHQEVTQ